MNTTHTEHHFLRRSGWLRAAVLGANDGIVSTASLLVGVAAAAMDANTMVLLGVAALVAGAMSMAAGEYVSVSSQSDLEQAELERERHELKVNEPHERKELTQIYQDRGLEPELAAEVAKQLMSHNALEAHARDELGLSSTLSARPLQAALSSGAAFAAGAAVPLMIVALTPPAVISPWLIGVGSLVCLAVLGFASARASHTKVSVAVIRVTFWGFLAMAVTALIGKLFAA